ncbi:MAG: ferritin-like domain-containing protein [Myxococcota bacterium]|nr:ferritin-like domain-containing protein [Myxococcota bacterium]
MHRHLVSQALRRAALVPFTLVACGGTAVSAGLGDSGTPATGNSSGSAGSSGSNPSSGAVSGSASGSTGGSSSGDASGAEGGAMSGASSGSTSGAESGSTSGSASGSSSGSDSGPGAGCTLASQTPTSGIVCGYTYALAGDISSCNPGVGGALTRAQCTALCPNQPAISCFVTAGSPPTLRCNGVPCQTGRRPEGLPANERLRAGDAVARYLAEMAWLEAASVPAFERLTRELEAHGAPQRLREATRRAALDEVRHADRIGALAARCGGVVDRPRVEALGVRSLEEIAIENAIEGCVRETFGAAVAAVQAERAGDAGFREAMKPIARDEARHAQLSWELAEWLDGKLDEDARRRVSLARRRGAEELWRETSVAPEASVARELGVPTRNEAQGMLQSLRESLWS